MIKVMRCYKSKKCKHLKYFLLGVLTVGGVIPAVSSCSKKTFLTNLQNISRNEYFSFANSLYNKKFASDDSGTDSTNITLKRLNDYINISKTKLTYKLLFAGASCSKDNSQVQNIVGTYLHNVTPTNNLDSKGLQEQYQKVKEENQKVGIDVVDFDEFKNYSTPLFIDNYVQGYKNEDGISSEQAEELKQILLSSYSDIGNEAMQNLDGQAELSFALVDDESFDQMSPDIDHYQARINAKLQAALKFEQVLFNDKQLQVNDTSPEFLKYYSDYTTDGKTTPDSKIKALSVGDIVPENLLQYLLTYNYDTVYGADYAEAEYYGFDITPDEICANTNSEYDPIALGLCSYTQPLSSLQTAYCTYGVGEFLPGYALELAIKSIDDTTDSHQCKMVFTKLW